MCILYIYIIHLQPWEESARPHGAIFQQISRHGADSVELPQQSPHIHGLAPRKRRLVLHRLSGCTVQYNIYIYIYYYRYVCNLKSYT